MIYVAGPISGIEGENREAFERARALLMQRHACVRTPHDVVWEAVALGRIAPEEAGTWEGCMRACLAHVVGSWRAPGDPQALGLAMLDGWEGSRGATIEHDLAAALGIPCKEWREWL